MLSPTCARRRFEPSRIFVALSAEHDHFDRQHAELWQSSRRVPDLGLHPSFNACLRIPNAPASFQIRRSSPLRPPVCECRRREAQIVRQFFRRKQPVSYTPTMLAELCIVQRQSARAPSALQIFHWMASFLNSAQIGNRATQRPECTDVVVTWAKLPSKSAQQRTSGGKWRAASGNPDREVRFSTTYSRDGGAERRVVVVDNRECYSARSFRTFVKV
jgi:hypothetical protein